VPPGTPPAAIEVHQHGTTGRQVAVLHGGPGAPGSACSLARTLADRFAVIEPLQRRSGELPLTVRQHIEDHAVVLPGRVALVGWSWGAMLALSYAAAHPERVSSLALVGCGTYDQASRKAYQRAMSARLGPYEDRFKELAGRCSGLADTPELEADALMAELGALAERAQSVDLIEQPEASLPGDPVGNAQTWQDVLDLQASGREPAAFAAITCPVLMLHGRDDPHPGPMIYERIRRHLPQLKYVDFRECGHRPWLERAAHKEFLATLRAWLNVSGN
jgi:pimeloyl-ACP methyl ester carboxylesterase